MCGLIGAFNSKNKKNVNKWVTYQLQDQLDRGQEGLGAIFIDDHKNIEIERATEITKTLIDLRLMASKMMILHHRNPTSSENKIQETHPILVSNKKLKHDYYIIHNGIIRNEHLLREKHQKLGFIYTTLRKSSLSTWNDALGTWTKRLEFNDSESFAIEIARFIDTGLKKIEADGTWAFIALQVNKKTKKAIEVFCGKDNFNPLNLLTKKGQIRLSSEGEGTPIKEFRLYHFNLNNLKVHKSRHIFVRELTEKEEEPIIIETKTNNKNLTKRTKNLNPDEPNEPIEESPEYPLDYDTCNSHNDEDPDTIIDEANEEVEKHMEVFWDTLKDESFLYTLIIEDDINDTLIGVIAAMKKAYNDYKKAKINQSLKESYGEQINDKKTPLGFIESKKK